MNLLISKWDWIATKCKEMEYFSACNVAEFVANTERQMNGESVSWLWVKHIRDVELQWKMRQAKAMLLIAVARFKPFNIGCLRHGDVCGVCMMGKRYGACMESGSISHFWEHVLLKDYGGEMDEENLTVLLTGMKAWWSE